MGSLNSDGRAANLDARTLSMRNGDHQRSDSQDYKYHPNPKQQSHGVLLFADGTGSAHGIVSPTTSPRFQLLWVWMRIKLGHLPTKCTFSLTSEEGVPRPYATRLAF